MVGNSNKNTPVGISMIAGGTAGAVEAVFNYPIESVKTRMQLRGFHTKANPFKTLYTVWAAEGTAAIYKGCVPFVFGSIGKDIVRFVSFDLIKNQFKDKETGKLTPLRTMGAAMTSGILASTLAVTPSERIKTAMIDDARGEKRFRNAFDCVRTIVKEDGFLGIYRGYAGTTMKQAGATAFRIGTYDILKTAEKSYGIEQTTIVNFINGAISGTITTYTTQPFDTIKTRSQAARGTSTVQAFRSIVADGGVAAFWKGSVMRLSRNATGGGILFTTFELVSKILEPFWEKRNPQLAKL